MSQVNPEPGFDRIATGQIAEPGRKASRAMRTELAVELDKALKFYKREHKGRTIEEMFDLDVTRNLHEGCRRAQIALGEDPTNEARLKERGFMEGTEASYYRAVDQLLDDLRKA